MDWHPSHIPDLSGKTIVVTGANSGIGLCAAEELAARGTHVILACRSREKGRVALERIRARRADADVVLESLDLSSLASVRAFAELVRGRHARLDVLVNNAGVMALPFAKTADGFEMQVGTNHLGHFALTALLWPSLVANDGARVVTVGSVAHFFGNVRLEDLCREKGYSRWSAYAQSKLCNMLFAKELARRVERARLGVTSVACHPGYASTNLQVKTARIRGSSFEETLMNVGNTTLAQSASWGSMPTLYAATHEVTPGSYIGPSGPLGLVGMPAPARTSGRANDPELAARLWALSEELTKTPFDVTPLR
jgi:NAD(P)-dependent dehydrogenase (short-subunit alcohol dehydrogenase family)